MDKQHVQSNLVLIAVVLMIKNESTSIQSTLSSLFDGGIRHFLIFDTGSTDTTLELVHGFFEQHQLGAYVTQEPFIDFSSSRNRALELAEQHFADIPFLLMPDAEWYLHQAEALIKFCAQEINRDTPLYLIKIKMHLIEFTTARLFRTASHIRFQGVVHEAPSVVTQVKAPDSVYFEVKASEEGIKKSNRRWQQDLVLLSNAHAENPQDPRTVFYLAQTYECLNKLENAYRFYQIREKLPGWDEENFITLFRLGGLTHQLSLTNPQYSWATAMDYFLKAFSQRPHRIEPLVQIANYYWPNNIQTCYLFIRYAYDIPYPKNDILFIDKQAYEYTRYEIMSRCAWYMGEYILGEQATLLALNITPDMEHLQNNLVLYQDKLKSIEAVSSHESSQRDCLNLREEMSLDSYNPFVMPYLVKEYKYHEENKTK